MYRVCVCFYGLFSFALALFEGKGESKLRLFWFGFWGGFFIFIIRQIYLCANIHIHT